MRMARVNVYLPDELAEASRAAGLNVSRIAQDALARRARRGGHVDLDRSPYATSPATGVSHEEALDAVRAARDELDHD